MKSIETGMVYVLLGSLIFSMKLFCTFLTIQRQASYTGLAFVILLRSQNFAKKVGSRKLEVESGKSQVGTWKPKGPSRLS